MLPNYLAEKRLNGQHLAEIMRRSQARKCSTRGVREYAVFAYANHFRIVRLVKACNPRTSLFSLFPILDALATLSLGLWITICKAFLSGLPPDKVDFCTGATATATSLDLPTSAFFKAYSIYWPVGLVGNWNCSSYLNFIHTWRDSCDSIVCFLKITITPIDNKFPYRHQSWGDSFDCIVYFLSITIIPIHNKLMWIASIWLYVSQR